MKALLYCTKSKKKLFYDVVSKKWMYGLDKPHDRFPSVNGTIVAECDIETEELRCACVPYRKTNNLGYEHFIDNGVYKVVWTDKNKSPNSNLDGEGVVFERDGKYIDTMIKNEELEKTCLSPQQLLDYVHLAHRFYLLHISNLQIFDSSRQLSDYKVNNMGNNGEFGWFLSEEKYSPLQKAPQNMMRVYDEVGNKYILISIRPEWLCKILNGDKTIEVRKQVLKEMIGE